MQRAHQETEDGCWLPSAASLPSGGYTWHRFPGRGYVALVGTAPIASVSQVSQGGWSLRIESFHWRGVSGGAATLAEVPSDCRMFGSSRGAIAAAGRILAGPPHYRQERVGPVTVSRGSARRAPEQDAAEDPQAALAL